MRFLNEIIFFVKNIDLLNENMASKLKPSY